MPCGWTLFLQLLKLHFTTKVVKEHMLPFTRDDFLANFATYNEAIWPLQPWGTTYPPNLRLIASKMTEDFFLRIASTLETAPPMPWYNVRRMTETDIRSLYRYIRSLGEPGAAAPLMVAPGDRVKTPYILVAPPQPVPPCGSDFDCGIGEICGTTEPRQCVKR